MILLIPNYNNLFSPDTQNKLILISYIFFKTWVYHFLIKKYILSFLLKRNEVYFVSRCCDILVSSGFITFVTKHYYICDCYHICDFDCICNQML